MQCDLVGTGPVHWEFRPFEEAAISRHRDTEEKAARDMSGPRLPFQRLKFRCATLALCNC
jgi:hypothetical protein